MTVHRFFIAHIQFFQESITLQDDVAWQIAKVLRLMPGDVITLFDGSGKEYQIVLESVEKKQVTGKKVLEFINNTEPTVSVILYQALLPRETYEHVLQKGTEIGVCTFVPVACARSIVRAKDISSDKITRWKKIVQEAAEQSERGNVPAVLPPVSFEDAIGSAVTQGTVLIAWEHEDAVFLSDVISHVAKEKPVALFVGPEGGFTEEEIAFAKAKGAHTISLGPRVLRSETAGPVFTALVLYGLQDLSRKGRVLYK
jgi:16S rRNA (uracil1498-N3)-methyltransferase